MGIEAFTWFEGKFGYVFPDWYWVITLILVAYSSILRKFFWKYLGTTGSFRLPLLHKNVNWKSAVLVCPWLGLGLVALLLIVVFPNTIVEGIIFEGGNVRKPIQNAEVTIIFLKSRETIEGETDLQGKFSISCPRLSLDEADVVVTDPRKTYSAVQRSHNLRESRFLRLSMEKGIPAYTIKFEKPSSYVPSPGFLEVLATFRAEKGGNVVYIPDPRTNIKLLIDGVTTEYREIGYPSTDRVTLISPSETFGIDRHEIRIVTRHVDTLGQENEISATTWFSPLWHDNLRTLDNWVLPSREKPDWQPSDDGIRGELQPEDSGNVLWLNKEIAWRTIAFDFEFKILNNDRFANIVIMLGRDHHRIVVGDGDLEAVRFQRAAFSDGQVSWPISAPSHQLNIAIDPKYWHRITVQVDLDLEAKIGTLRMRLLCLKELGERTYMQKIPERIIFLKGLSSPHWFGIGIGHLNPQWGEHSESSSVKFANFRIYAPME